MKRKNVNPQPPRPITKRRQLTNRDRFNIVEYITNEVHTFTETAEHFKLPESTVRSVYKTFEQTGRLAALPRGANRSPRLEKKHLKWIKNRLLQDPSLPISDLHAELNKKFKLQPPVSRSAVQNVVDKKVAYTMKLLHPEPEEDNSEVRLEQRRMWAEEVWKKHGGVNDFVYLDESGFNLHIRRKYSRAPRDVRPNHRVPTQRGATLSLLIALDHTGLIASEVKIKTYKSVHFARFLKNKLFPKLQGHRTIIMDNCRIHKERIVKDTFDASPHTPLFLPLYTPHFNIAEWAFGCIQGHVKKKAAQRYNLAGCIRRSLQRSVTAARVKRWLKEVSWNVQFASADIELGRFKYPKHALRLMEKGADPYPEVEGDDVADEDREEVGEEEVDEVLEEKESFSESSSYSSDFSEDEAADDEEEDESEIAPTQTDEVGEDEEDKDEMMDDKEEREVLDEDENEEGEEEGKEQEQEQLHIPPASSRYSLRSGKQVLA